MPVLVIVKAFVLLSTMVAFCRVSKDVLVIAVSAAVGGMKLAVYTPVPLTRRTLEILPVKYCGPVTVLYPIDNALVELRTEPAKVPVPSCTPLTYNLILLVELPILVVAT